MPPVRAAEQRPRTSERTAVSRCSRTWIGTASCGKRARLRRLFYAKMEQCTSALHEDDCGDMRTVQQGSNAIQDVMADCQVGTVPPTRPPADLTGTRKVAYAHPLAHADLPHNHTDCIGHCTAGSVGLRQCVPRGAREIRHGSVLDVRGQSAACEGGRESGVLDPPFGRVPPLLSSRVHVRDGGDE